MKSKKTLVLTASILALTLSTFPHVAAADTTTAPPPASSDLTRPTGKAPMVYMRAILAVGDLISVLLP
jgi:hypothetical protein